ncbi:two-component sensor histidine kinase [Kineosporia sp. NBRC 101677]|uniref:sensor histidine kinase n=1 Tax=Kineosporia sp. NBRC 101677 TaxID=3032197 RepID=UPI0024A54037|nr:histidine kinase [Kineosporia sp. NBRC 101677]GLY13635.1 two-component sensor histidine kinase [Kineosporia sp. NBRC 101677]
MTRSSRLDENASLRRQSILIALLCLTFDGAIFFFLDVSGNPLGPALWLAAVTIAVVDLALALPAATAAGAAFAHGAARCLVAWLLVSTGQGGDSGIGNAVGLVLAGYRAGAWLRGRQSVAALAALVAGMTGAQMIQGFDSVGGDLLTTVSNTFLPWLVGRYTTARSGYIDEIERRAETERQAARQALVTVVAQERGAIARDLHDTISHHVSAMGMHASAARLGLAAGAGEEKVKASLGQVEASSQAAMSDLRRMLDLLYDDQPDGDHRAEVRQPGLRNLEELLEGSRGAGLPIRLHRPDLEPAHLPGSVDVAAYRVVQEILTNALRHGGGGTLDLVIDQDDTRLVVTGRNPVPASVRPSPGSGRGLDGIRHRAGLFSGTVQAGPEPDGRTWTTRVSFPLESEE